MRLAVTVSAAAVGAGVLLQLVLTLVSLIAGYMDAGSLAGDAGFFAAFSGLALVPLTVLLVLLASIGKWVRAHDARFFQRARWAAVTMMVLASALLLGNAGTLGGGIVPH